MLGKNYLSKLLFLTIYGVPVDVLEVLSDYFVVVNRGENFTTYKAIVDSELFYDLVVQELAKENGIVCTTYCGYRNTYADGQLIQRLMLH